MICVSCRDRHHDNCRGGTWCACQHQSGDVTEAALKQRLMQLGWYRPKPESELAAAAR